MAEGQDAVAFHQSDCKKPRFWPLNPSQWMPKTKGCRSPKCLHGSTFLPRRQILEGSLGRTGLEIQTMFERPAIFLHKRK
jgi:hypothetical protein